MINLQEPIFNPKVGHDVMTKVATLDFNPKAYKTCEEAAKACHEALRKVASAQGMNPDMEVFISAPGERHECWYVSWEAGPYEWAIPASFEITGPWGYTEPYYSFDLCFVEN